MFILVQNTLFKNNIHVWQNQYSIVKLNQKNIHFKIFILVHLKKYCILEWVKQMKTWSLNQHNSVFGNFPHNKVLLYFG